MDSNYSLTELRKLLIAFRYLLMDIRNSSIARCNSSMDIRNFPTELRIFSTEQSELSADIWESLVELHCRDVQLNALTKPYIYTLMNIGF